MNGWCGIGFAIPQCSIAALLWKIYIKTNDSDDEPAPFIMFIIRMGRKQAIKIPFR